MEIDDTDNALEVVLRQGQAVLVSLHNADGEFLIRYTDKEITVEAAMADPEGREGIIYREVFNEGPWGLDIDGDANDEDEGPSEYAVPGVRRVTVEQFRREQKVQGEELTGLAKLLREQLSSGRSPLRNLRLDMDDQEVHELFDEDVLELQRRLANAIFSLMKEHSESKETNEARARLIQNTFMYDLDEVCIKYGHTSIGYRMASNPTTFPAWAANDILRNLQQAANTKFHDNAYEEAENLARSTINFLRSCHALSIFPRPLGD